MKTITINYLLLCLFTLFSLSLTAQQVPDGTVVTLQNCGTGEFLTAAASGSAVTMSPTAGGEATEWTFEQNANGDYNIDSQIPTGVSGRGILRAQGSNVISTNISPGSARSTDGDKSFEIVYDAANNTYRFRNLNGTDRFMNIDENGAIIVSNVPATNLTSVWKAAPVALPLDFVSFKAQNNKAGTQLSWEIANEVDNDYFEVLKSNEANEFQSIGRVENATGQAYYQFLDQQVANQTSFYKIKQVDFDGTFSYSEVIMSISSNVESLTTYPNPVRQNENFTIDSPDGAEYQIFNSEGKLLTSGTQRTIRMDLGRGVYFIKQNGSAKVGRFIVQ